MRLAVQISDTATPALTAARERFGGRAANVAMAEFVAERIREHLRVKNQEPNKLNAPKTNFYAQARDATFTEVSETDAIIYIAKDGIRQRYFGGTINPVKAKALTIPVHPAAHGRTAREFGGELRFIAINRGNLIGLLKAGEDAAAPVLFLLVKQVKQDPDPTVLPTDDQLRAAAVEGLANLPV